jgi:hypothetical protein
MLSTNLNVGPPSGFFPSGFPGAPLLPPSLYMPRPPHPPRLDNSNLYFRESTNHTAHRYADFFTLPSLHPTSVQIFSSAPCSQTPWVYVPPLVSETMFHTHTEPQATQPDVGPLSPQHGSSSGCGRRNDFQHPGLKHPQFMFLNVRDQVSYPYRTIDNTTRCGSRVADGGTTSSILVYLWAYTVFHFHCREKIPEDRYLRPYVVSSYGEANQQRFLGKSVESYDPDEPWRRRRYILRNVGSNLSHKVQSSRRHLSLTPLVYVPLLMSETKFHTHRQNYSVVYSNFYIQQCNLCSGHLDLESVTNVSKLCEHPETAPSVPLCPGIFIWQSLFIVGL